ncbi:MAG: hypothetical protein AAGD32_04305 [Planctomycetota bacterium]
MLSSLERLVHEDHGGEVLEYAMVVGLLIVASIAVLLTFSAAPAKMWKAAQEEFATGAPE